MNKGRKGLKHEKMLWEYKILTIDLGIKKLCTINIKRKNLEIHQLWSCNVNNGVPQGTAHGLFFCLWFTDYTYLRNLVC